MVDSWRGRPELAPYDAVTDFIAYLRPKNLSQRTIIEYEPIEGMGTSSGAWPVLGWTRLRLGGLAQQSMAS